MGVRTEVEPEGRRSLMEPNRWRYEAQPKAQMSVAEVERCLTKVEQEGRGSPVEPEGQRG